MRDRKPGLGGRQGYNELQPKKRPRRLSTDARTNPIAEKEGERYEERLRLALCRVLVSPHFLFRVENDPPGAKSGEAYKISELELALSWAEPRVQPVDLDVVRAELRRVIYPWTLNGLDSGLADRLADDELRVIAPSEDGGVRVEPFHELWYW